MMARYGRQLRLVEIGEAGQAKLCAASVALVAEGFARVVEERYVRGSGMSITSAATPRAPVPAEMPELGLRHAPAREVADGAMLALVALRAVLESAS